MPVVLINHKINMGRFLKQNTGFISMQKFMDTILQPSFAHSKPSLRIRHHHYSSVRLTFRSKRIRDILIFLIGIVGGGVQLGPLGTAATNRPIVPAPGDYDDGEIGGMIGKGNESTRRKPAPVPLCSPQTPHAARTRTRAAAVGSQRLTA
jgi:hypothetical protein